MQLSLFRIILAVLIAVIGVRQELGYSVAEEMPYRLLHSDWRQFGTTKIANYAISIDRFLDRPQIEQLICQVLQDEKPSSYAILSIVIFYNLEKWIPGGLPSLDSERRWHYIAGYLWNRDLPNRTKQLTVYRDVHGNFLDPPQFYDFDHTKVCKQDAGQVER
jgi:hypothetical protein